jgi:hypothetical protein
MPYDNGLTRSFSVGIHATFIPAYIHGNSVMPPLNVLKRWLPEFARLMNADGPGFGPSHFNEQEMARWYEMTDYLNRNM